MRINVNNYLRIAVVLPIFVFVHLLCSVGSAAFSDVPGALCNADTDSEMTLSISKDADREDKTSSGVADELISDFFDLVPDELVSEDNSIDAVGMLGIEALLGEIFAAISGEGGRVTGFFLFVLGASVLMAVGELCAQSMGDMVRCGTMAVGACAIFSRIYPVIEEVEGCISTLSSLFSSLIPIMTAATAAGGGGGVASVQSAGMSFTLWLYGGMGSTFLMTLALGMFAAGLAGSVGDGFGNLCRSIGGAFTKGIGILTAFVAGTLSLQSLIASSMDTAAMRAAKYAASNLIPVVGGAVSGALSTLSGGLAYAVSIIGGGAVAVIVSVALVPLITLLLYKMCFFLVISFLDFVGSSKVSGCLGAMSKGLDALISVYSMTAIIYIFEVILFLKSGVALL